MRNPPSGRRDRVLAAIEIPALGIWLGALVGFAFISAPLAFAIVAPLDVARFAALTAQTIGVLTFWGYALGTIAIVATLARSASAADRTWDFARAALVLVALGLATYEQRAIVPAMTTTDVRSPEYRALHQRSTQVYGGGVLLVLVALVLAASRRED